MIITKQRLVALLFNAIWADGVEEDEKFKESIGITDEELQAIISGNVEYGLTQEERYEIVREVDR